jgi:hypothetical protein
MPTTAAAPPPLTFEQFWRWLLEHRGCLVRCGSPDVFLMDNDLLHWDFFEEPDGTAICQALLGKALVGEMLVEKSEVSFVQASADVENPNSGHWVFECLGGQREDNFPLYFFVMTHGLEGAQGHQQLKH